MISKICLTTLVLLFFICHIQADESVDPYNELEAYPIDPIEVTGNRLSTLMTNPLMESLGLNPSTTIINASSMEKQGSNTLIDAMEYAPGSWIETRGRKVKQLFSVRGQKYPYPEYSLDGAWQREFLDLPYFFSSSDIENIQIIRSSSALLNGLSGLSGVINIVPKEYKSPKTESEIEYGTFDTYRFHISHGAGTEKSSYTFRLGSNHTNGPDDKYSKENITNFSGTIRLQPIKSLSIKTDFFHIYGMRQLAKADPPADMSFQNALERFDPINTTIFNLKANFHPNFKTSTDLTMFFSNRDDKYVVETQVPYTANREWDYEWGANLIQSLSISNDNVLRIGGLYNHWIAPYGKRFYVGKRCDLETFSAVIVDEHRFGKLSFDAGLRWYKNYIQEYGGFNIEGTSGAFKNVNPIKDQWELSVFNGSIGIAYYISNNMSFHLNTASGYIQPRVGTLDVNLETPKNEKRIKLDVGFKAMQRKAGSISIIGFATKQNNAIMLSGKTKELNGRIMELYENMDREQVGLEFDIQSSRLLNVIKPFANIVVMRSRIKANNGIQDNKDTPKFISNLGIYTSKSGIDANLFWKYVSSYESTRFVATIKGQPTMPVSLGNYNQLNATMGYSFGKRHQTRLYMEIRNILDKRFSTVAGYPDFGRTITIGVKKSI